MRGIASIAKAVTFASASARVVSGDVSGARKPTRTDPSPSFPISSLVGGGDLDDDVGAPRVADLRAGLLEQGVGDQRGLARAGLDDDLDVLRAQALDDVGDDARPGARRAAVSLGTPTTMGAES